MPELPEVETVRRGLDAAMAGARFRKVEVHRGDLRWPLPPDFARRLEGKTVTGIGRRGKYLLADLSCGDVLIMHLGMSGSFYVFYENDRRGGGKAPGGYYHQRAQHVAHDHVVFHSARTFIIAILHRAFRYPWERIRPHAAVGVPAGATSLERRALIEAVEEAGVSRVHLIPEPVAGAIGCGIDPLQPRAHMVVDVGGGTAEVSAFCFGGILATRSCRVAGDEMTVALHQYLRQEHQLMVGELTAEDIKIHLREAAAEGQPLVIEGRDVLTSRPRLITLDPQQVADALRPTVDGIIDALTGCLEDLPPQAVGDIMHEGVIAFGGGSLLAGFEQRLEEEFGFSVHHAERPLTCVAEGAALIISMPAVIAAYSAG